ncbi:pilus assembly protein TadG-related protein [Microbacterium sp. C7(2022)]|uniref:pilus assembly protein TadG-related protein n=1 Tax=Microbacterium sp. C7(2022) TaxID=2992759 RepID=UPI00237A0F53|nr:pilus assembly protein TadG-related protein [Microbacterium sp. C7(2022)]MDE0545647.1 pilus assembly protein TadG-related protein [Microbacterium sp. C7(2022)]
MILALGYAVLAIVLILVCVDATSLYLAQKRLDATADAAALAAADSFTLVVKDGEPAAILTSDGVHTEATSLLSAIDDAAAIASATTPDGVSARVTVTTTWHPPVSTLFVPEGVVLESTATSRTVLR